MSSSTPTEAPAARRPDFLAVCAPSGGGKTSFTNALIAAEPGSFARAPSYTTRPRRPDDRGGEYSFVSAAEFHDLQRRGELLNADHVFENWYGISRRGLADIQTAGAIAVKEMAVANVAQLKAAGAQPLIVYLEPNTDFSPRPGRNAETDRVLGAPADAPRDVPIVRLLRDGKSPQELVADFCRWLAAGEVLAGADEFVALHSGAWDDRNEAGYDAIAPEFTDARRLTTALFHELSRPFWQDWVGTRVVPGGAYLEVAPGRGWLRESVDWPAGADYRGLELSSAMRALNAEADRVDLGSAALMPYASQNFDGVLGSLIDPLLNATFLAETRRILRPGGWIALTAPAHQFAAALRGGGVHTTSFIAASGEACSVGSLCAGERQLKQALEAIGFAGVRIWTCDWAPGSTPPPPPVADAWAARPADIARLPLVMCCVAELGHG